MCMCVAVCKTENGLLAHYIKPCTNKFPSACCVYQGRRLYIYFGTPGGRCELSPHARTHTMWLHLCPYIYIYIYACI